MRIESTAPPYQLPHLVTDEPPAALEGMKPGWPNLLKKLQTLRES